MIIFRLLGWKVTFSLRELNSIQPLQKLRPLHQYSFNNSFDNPEERRGARKLILQKKIWRKQWQKWQKKKREQLSGSLLFLAKLKRWADTLHRTFGVEAILKINKNKPKKCSPYGIRSLFLAAVSLPALNSVVCSAHCQTDGAYNMPSRPCWVR